jgi:hypothetical protein
MEDTWEARMARRAAARRPPPPPPYVDDPARRADQPWLNGWPRLGTGDAVLIGTGMYCVCCGRLRGVTTVAFSADWEPPGPEPVWPFGEADCPLCKGR